MKNVRGMIGLYILTALLLTGCGNSRAGGFALQQGTYHSGAAASEEQEPVLEKTGAEEADTEGTDMEEAQTEQGGQSSEDAFYMILQHDTQNYNMTLLNLSDNSQNQYEYTDGTEFFDKYQDYVPAYRFTVGSLIEIQRMNRNETLGAVAYTSDTWDYDNVRRFSIDMDNNEVTIADTKYTIDASRFHVFSDGEPVTPGEITEDDVVTVYGIDRQVYSIVVEEGHGTLALTNTELFEGGWLSLGTKVYVTVTKDMTMDIPEGVYLMEVANDGYGDSGEVRIRRGRVTTIDLNDYKGEGVKNGSVTFRVGVENAKVLVDGETVNTSKPVELRYGVHNLTVVAAGYDTWTKNLVVNSPSTTIDIALSDAKSSGSKASDDTTDTSSSGKSSSSSTASSGSTAANVTPGSKAGSLAGSHTRQSTSGSGSNKDLELSDAALNSSMASVITGGDSQSYVDTLADLVESLEKLNRSGSSSDEED